MDYIQQKELALMPAECITISTPSMALMEPLSLSLHITYEVSYRKLISTWPH